MERVMGALRGLLAYGQMFCAFSFVGLGIVVALLWFDGHLSVAKLERLGDVLREDPRAPEKPAQVLAPIEVQAELDASRAALTQREARWREEQELLSSALRTLREEVERGRAQLGADRAKLAEEQAEFAVARDAQRKLQQSESFKNNVRILTKLASKDAAAFVKEWTAEEIVAYVRKLRDRDSAKLLVELDGVDAQKTKEVRTLLKEQAAQDAKR